MPSYQKPPRAYAHLPTRNTPMFFQYLVKHRTRIMVVATVLVATAGVAFAQSEPLVSCGRTGGISCNLCDLYVLAKNVINFALFWLALPIAVIVFLWGGILLLTSRGSEEQLKQGKAALTNAVLGIIIAFAAWLIINTLLVTLGFGIKFTQGILPWNTFPTCEAPIATTFIPPVQKAACDIQNGPFSRSCTTPTGPGVEVCEDNGTWSACNEFCSTEELGKTRTCTIGNCPGSQTCAGGPGQSFWSACADNTSDACIPKLGGGSCTPTQQGDCAVNNLAGICFGNLAAEASQICLGESGGNAARGSGDDLTKDGRSFSWGLFQINLKSHTLGSLDCPKAFNKSANTIIDEDLYSKCVAAAKDPATNVRKACEIRAAAGNWSRDWTNIAHNCRLP